MGACSGSFLDAWASFSRRCQRVVDLITRHMADRLDDLVRTKRTPDRGAIGKLSVEELRRIGCSISDTDDQIVVRPVATDAEKLVSGFLNGDPE